MSIKIRFKDIYSFNTENSVNIKSEELEKEITFKLAKVAYKEFYSNIVSNKGIKTAFRKSINKGLVEIKDQFRVFVRIIYLAGKACSQKELLILKNLKIWLTILKSLIF